MSEKKKNNKSSKPKENKSFKPKSKSISENLSKRNAIKGASRPPKRKDNK